MRKLLLGTLSLAVAMSLNAKVLATVDGTSITDAEMNAMMQSMQRGMSYDKLPDNMKKKALEQAVERKLLIKNAIQSGVKKTSEYKKALNTVENNIALDVWMKKQFDKVKVSDAQAKKFYKDNGTKFMQPARLKARHILLKDEKSAKAVISQLKGLNGKKLEDKFTSLAKTKSTGPSAKKGGELGWFPEKQMVPEFSKATKALKKGAITKTPVKTQYGYHVILKEGSEASKKIEFSKVKEQIINQLKMEQFKKDVSAKAKALKAKAKISYK